MATGDQYREGPPVAYGPCSRLGPLGAYGGPAGYRVVDAETWRPVGVGEAQRDDLEYDP